MRSLSKEVQKLYDDYATADKAAKEKAQTLNELQSEHGRPLIPMASAVNSSALMLSMDHCWVGCRQVRYVSTRMTWTHDHFVAI